MTDLRAVLDELVADAPLNRADWHEVILRSRRAPDRDRSRRRLLIACAVIVLLGATGAAIAASIDLLAQQDQFHEQIPDDPKRQGRSVQVASGDNWALIAWNSDAGICLDFAINENSTFSCGFPVRGAKPVTAKTGSGPTIHAIAGAFSAGNLVGGDGEATIFGVMAHEVARATVELVDGRVVTPQVYDAPSALNSRIRFFIVRLRLDELERGLSRKNPVHAYNAFNGEGRLVERVRD